MNKFGAPALNKDSNHLELLKIDQKQRLHVTCFNFGCPE